MKMRTNESRHVYTVTNEIINLKRSDNNGYYYARDIHNVCIRYGA